MSIDPPYKMGPFERITNVHFGNLYLVVSLFGANSAGSTMSPCGVGAPGIGSQVKKPNVKLLDTFSAPGSGNSNGSGFVACFDYSPSSVDAVLAFKISRGIVPPPPNITFGGFPAVGNSCPWPGGGEPPPDTAVVPIDYFAFAGVQTDFLYTISPGTDLTSFSISGLVANNSAAPDDVTGISTSGSGGASVFVYSRVKGRITKLSQLINYNGDGKLRPTEDDQCQLALPPNTQGSFSVHVQLDKDKAHAQIDNYGKTFQPYKVTLDRGDTIDVIPAQPPPFLG